VLRAVLFDWGNTLVRSELDPELLIEGHRRALEAVGRGASARQEAFTERYSEVVLPPLLMEREDEVDYPMLVAAVLAEFDITLDPQAVWRFVAVEHAAWRTAHPVEPESLELLDALRARGLRVGLVSNLFDPPALVRETFAELGVLPRLDAVALSAEVGWRKPNRALFDHALGELDVVPADAVHVGDRRREDVGGAHALGLRTIQARWYSVDDDIGPEPTARAETRADVLRLVDDWLSVS
jgi:FMN phosphatase YigB (HAD superfamily)